jgi:hypothetical protein
VATDAVAAMKEVNQASRESLTSLPDRCDCVPDHLLALNAAVEAEAGERGVVLRRGFRSPQLRSDARRSQRGKSLIEDSGQQGGGWYRLVETSCELCSRFYGSVKRVSDFVGDCSCLPRASTGIDQVNSRVTQMEPGDQTSRTDESASGPGRELAQQGRQMLDVVSQFNLRHDEAWRVLPARQSAALKLLQNGRWMRSGGDAPVTNTLGVTLTGMHTHMGAPLAVEPTAVRYLAVRRASSVPCARKSWEKQSGSHVECMVHERENPGALPELTQDECLHSRPVIEQPHCSVARKKQLLVLGSCADQGLATVELSEYYDRIVNDLAGASSRRSQLHHDDKTEFFREPHHFELLESWLSRLTRLCCATEGSADLVAAARPGRSPIPSRPLCVRAHHSGGADLIFATDVI